MKATAQPVRRRGWASIAALVFAAAAAWAPLPALGADRASGESAGQILGRFRQSIWSEPVYAEVLLRELPREGDEFDYRGRFWGGRDAAGPVTRLEIDVGKGGYSRHVLIQGGPDPAVWLWDPAESPAPAAGPLAEPLAPRLVMTPLDVLPMPYLFWLDADLAGTGRIRGRPAHMFILTPSAEFRAANPSVASVRVYLDTQYDALVQSEVIGSGGSVTRTLSLLDLKRVGNRWIPKDLDVRDEKTRDKTRLSITAVAVGADPGAAAFDPARLGEALQPPPRVDRVP